MKLTTSTSRAIKRWITSSEPWLQSAPIWPEKWPSRMRWKGIKAELPACTCYLKRFQLPSIVAVRMAPLTPPESALEKLVQKNSTELALVINSAAMVENDI